MPDTLELFAAIDCRHDHAGPGRIAGTIVTYGEESRDSRRHVFQPGSLHWPSEGVVLNRQHSDGAPIARIVPTVDGDRVTIDHQLSDTAAGRDAAREVRDGLLIGLSAEVLVETDHHSDGRRMIERAELGPVNTIARDRGTVLGWNSPKRSTHASSRVSRGSVAMSACRTCRC